MLPAKTQPERRSAGQPARPLNRSDHPARRLLRGAPVSLCVATLALFVGALGVAGCGSGASDGSTAGSASQEATNLRVALDADGPGKEKPQHESLVCVTGDETPAGGQSVFGDCSAVDQLPADFGAPTPPNTACTEIFGGPEVVTISGTLRGKQLDTKLTRADGCEIDRFDPFVPILQELFPDYKPGGAIGA